MPCSRCGEWTYHWRWCSWYRPSTEDLATLWDWQFDPREDGLVWFRRCVPSCRSNTLLAQVVEIESSLSTELWRLRQLIEAAHHELDVAWQDLDR